MPKFGTYPLLGIDIECGVYEYRVLKAELGDQLSLISALEHLSRGGAPSTGTDTNGERHGCNIRAGRGFICSQP